jgi:mono/diheme cytochrome c family protein
MKGKPSEVHPEEVSDMRFLIGLAVLTAGLVLVSLTAVSTARSTEIDPAASRATEPALATSSAGRGDESNGSPIEGRRIFMRENCYSCHGGFAGGNMCPSLRERKPDDDEVRQVVRNGTRNGMPPFPELTEVDIQNLAAYFESLRTRREPTFTHWWEPVPTQ